MTKHSTSTTDLVNQATTHMQQAYAPYSQFKVGACIETAEGQFFGGCNVENASYSLTLCAEAVAIGNMIAAGQKQIKAIAIVGQTTTPCPPCGACRQRLQEFSTPDTWVHIANPDGLTKTFTLAELLPESFNVNHLV